MATNNAAEMIPRIALKGTLGVSGPLNSDYDALINKPQINGNELVGNKTNAELGIPTELADLTADADHRTVSDTEKETWNAKSDFSGSYNDLNDVPEDLVEDAEYVHTDNNYTSAEKTKLGDIEFGAEVNIQADWNETDTSSDAYIQNKPTIPAAQVNSDWNASSGVAEILHKPILGTAAAKDYTGSVLENSTDLVESGAVKTAIDNAISSVYKPAGNKACAELVSALLIAANLGNVYNMTDDGVTTADFVEGAGKAIEAGDNVVIVDIGSSVYKFDLLSGMVDLSNYVQKSSTSGLIKNDGTIDQTAYAKQNEMSVSTNGDQTTIQLKNETTATVINAHQDISGKANKSEMTVTPGTGSDADKTTIQLKSGTDATVLTQHQDISGKVDKEQGKGLSTNDYTTAEKEKLAAISTEANKVTASETNGNIQIDGTETKVYDDTELQGAVSNLEDDVEEIQGELTTELATVEGNPLNFSTKSAQNAKSTILSLEPIQDLHGYDKPWIGGAGKNLVDIPNRTVGSQGSATIYGENCTITKDGEILSFSNIRAWAKAIIQFPVTSFTIGETYAISATYNNPDQNVIRLVAYYISPTTSWASVSDNSIEKNIRLEGSITIESGHDYIAFGLAVNNTSSSKENTTVTISNIQIEKGSVATTWNPYENICPISGRTEIGILGCGKNLLDKTNVTNGYVDVNGVIYDTGPFLKLTNYIFINGAKLFTISGHRQGGYSAALCFYDKYKNYISGQKYMDNSPKTITPPNGASYVRFSIWAEDIDNVQMEVGNQATVYESYTINPKLNDLTISFGQTVYGGTLDLENGVLVVDKARQKLSDLTWTSATGNYAKFTTNSLVGVIKGSNTEKVVISELYKSEDNTTVPANQNHIYANGGEQVKIWDDAYASSDVSAWLTARGDSYICYELATPITINLTPHTINLLKGVNNISTDGDKITLTYRNGSVATLGDLTSAVESLDGKIDESKILTDTATGDKYILVVTNGVLSVEQISN